MLSPQNPNNNNHNMYTRLLLAALLFSVQSVTFSQGKVSLKIIQTSDIHGAFFPFDYINNRAVDYGLSQVSSYVNAERSKNPQGVVLLDNGDLLQGQPTVYYANFIDTSTTHIAAQILNYMGYDAATPGNHDIEAGPNVYNKLVEQFNFPWLSANTIHTKTGKPYFKPYHIIERKGVRIAVLGLTTPGIPNWLSPSLWPNMEFTDMIETAQMWMDTIRLKENPHLVIGLFHAGHNAGHEGQNPNQSKNENASMLVAQRVPGFDAILIGHDHDRVCFKVANITGDSVLIIDPGTQGRLVSDIQIEIELSASGKVLSKVLKGSLVDVTSMIPDPHYVAKFIDFSANVAAFVDRRIGSFSESVSTRDAYFGPSAFMNLIHTVQLNLSDAHISFAAPLMFDATIEKGPVFVRDVFKLYSYENLLYVMNLYGHEIKSYLEFSVNLWFESPAQIALNALKLRKSPDGKLSYNSNGRAILASSYYNFDSAAGINYIIDLAKPHGQRVTILSMVNDEPFLMDKVYRVALNSYRGNGGGGHLVDGVGLSSNDVRNRLVSASPMDMRYYLMKWIERNGRVIPATPNNWRLEPNEELQPVLQNDKRLLFGNQ